jgi:hypothetical protein
MIFTLLALTRGKRAQGKTYVDPAAGSELFGAACEAFIMSSAIQASPDSRELYMSNYRAKIRGLFAHRTLAQMSTQVAADEVTELLTTEMAGSSIGHRRVTRMIITGTMDAAARAEKIGRHKFTGIRLTEGTRPAAAPDDDDDAAGFVTITDAQVTQLAEGMTVTDKATGRKRTLTGVGPGAVTQHEEFIAMLPRSQKTEKGRLEKELARARRVLAGIDAAAGPGGQQWDD